MLLLRKIMKRRSVSNIVLDQPVKKSERTKAMEKKIALRAKMISGKNNQHSSERFRRKSFSKTEKQFS